MVNKKNKKVIIAMSGGVDSSVVAALLKRAGFEVVGVFMRMVDSPRFREGEKKAKKVARVLDIPFLVFDLKKEFKKRIISSFLKEYKAGFTPNLCVVCNKEIKFGLLVKRALRLKPDFVATGHYAQIQKREEKFHLLKGKDKEKDQSYFLWQLNQKQLKRILFPLGGYTKAQVKKIAKKLKLPTFNTPESQEVCFIQNTLNDFLRKNLEPKKGKIVDLQRKILGQHYGLWFYTIGQRKGIRLPGGPYYVLAKDLKRNLLIVTKKEKDLYKKELVFKKVNWISSKKPHLPLKVQAKIRYRSNPASATIINKGKLKVYCLKFKVAQRAVTPGQSAVFYQGQELLGGGIIC